MTSSPAQQLMLMGDGFSHSRTDTHENEGCSMDRQKLLEWAGVATAILYSMLIAFNIGAEFIGFTLLLISAISIAIWAYRNNFKGILVLQVFYASAGLVGMLRWF